MSISTDEMYNSHSRFIHKKFVIHFSASEILEVSKSDYLVQSSILEESFKLSDSPFGEVTSNELTLTLFNEDGMFNPANSKGKYYGLIKKGIKIESFIKVDEVDEWSRLGVFYVTNWVANSGGISASVTAYDILYNVINGSVPSFPVYRNVEFNEFINDYFEYFNITDVEVDTSINWIIPYAYTSAYSSNKEFLSDLMIGALADCFCNHDGGVVIKSKASNRPLRATLTDDDQVISMSIKQSIDTDYDSVNVTCNIGQESSEQSLLSVSDVKVSVGNNGSGKLVLNSQPALSIKSIKTEGSNAVTIPSFNASANEFECILRSTAVTNTSLNVFGTVLETVSSNIGELGDAPLSVDSRYVQDSSKANEILKYAEDYVKASVPTLEVTARGNPNLQLGDKISIESDFYKINYTGIIVKAEYKYTGNLSAVLTLIDASALKEV